MDTIDWAIEFVLSVCISRYSQSYLKWTARCAFEHSIGTYTFPGVYFKDTVRYIGIWRWLVYCYKYSCRRLDDVHIENYLLLRGFNRWLDPIHLRSFEVSINFIAFLEIWVHKDVFFIRTSTSYNMVVSSFNQTNFSFIIRRSNVYIST